MKNQDIRKAIESAGLFYWEAAYQYGLTDGNFSKLLRKELPSNKKIKVYEAIEAAKNEHKEETQND